MSGLRSKHEIIESMLLAAMEKTVKNNIMMRTGLSSTQMARYMDIIMQNGLMEMYRDGDHPRYVVAEKGRHYLQVMNNLHSMCP